MGYESDVKHDIVPQLTFISVINSILDVFSKHEVYSAGMRISLIIAAPAAVVAFAAAHIAAVPPALVAVSVWILLAAACFFFSCVAAAVAPLLPTVLWWITFFMDLFGNKTIALVIATAVLLRVVLALATTLGLGRRLRATLLLDDAGGAAEGGAALSVASNARQTHQAIRAHQD